MAALILFQLGFGLWMTRFVPDLIARFTLTQTHKSWGTVIFALALVRVAWRLVNRARPPLPPMPAWQARAARASHALLYLFMLLMPLSGWLLASASPVQDLLQMQNLVFGRLRPARPLRARQRRGSRPPLHRVHTSAAVGLALLLALHVAAALRTSSSTATTSSPGCSGAPDPTAVRRSRVERVALHLLGLNTPRRSRPCLQSCSFRAIGGPISSPSNRALNPARSGEQAMIPARAGPSAKGASRAIRHGPPVQRILHPDRVAVPGQPRRHLGRRASPPAAGSPTSPTAAR